MSPLDPTDYDRIQQIIDRAIEPIAASIKLMMPKDESLSRHSATQERIMNIDQRITKTETSVSEVVKWVMGENEKTANKIDTRFANVEDSIKEVGKQIDDLKADISANRSTNLRYIVTVIVSVIIGILIPILLKVIGV